MARRLRVPARDAQKARTVDGKTYALSYSNHFGFEGKMRTKNKGSRQKSAHLAGFG